MKGSWYFMITKRRYIHRSSQNSLLHFKTCVWHRKTRALVAQPHNQRDFWYDSELCLRRWMTSVVVNLSHPFHPIMIPEAFPSPGCGGHLTVRHRFDECSSSVVQGYSLIRRTNMNFSHCSICVCYFTHMEGQNTKIISCNCILTNFSLCLAG